MHTWDDDIDEEREDVPVDDDADEQWESVHSRCCRR